MDCMKNRILWIEIQTQDVLIKVEDNLVLSFKVRHFFAFDLRGFSCIV